MIGQSIGNYRLIKLLGRGGMGEVYLAEDLRLKRQVALKILRSEAAVDHSRLQRFEREATSAATLNHPNICVIHEIGEENGTSFIAMEYIEGETLAERIKGGDLQLADVLAIAIQIADALEEARKKGVVHRDLKPANIMITPRKQIKILDFGLAKHMPSDITNASTASNLTESGIVMGTIAYMSPEQALGKVVDQRSDIFPFGVLLYEMLTGRLPFTGSTSTEIIDSILHKDPPPVTRYAEGVPDELIRIVGKMLQKNPEERYQLAHDIWIDLRGSTRLPTPSTRSAIVFMFFEFCSQFC